VLERDTFLDTVGISGQRVCTGARTWLGERRRLKNYLIKKIFAHRLER